jgi:WXG100 family type VII secretion target
MAFEGMDPDQVEQHGRQLLAESGNIEHLIQTITGQVTTLAASWQGHDSDQFHSEWSNTYLRQMQSARDALHTLGTVALHNADEQRRTSSGL